MTSPGMWKLAVVGVAAFCALMVLVNSSSGFSLIGAFAILVGAVWYAERSEVTSISVRHKAVFITGCDTGFGHELAHHLDSIGVTVFAGCLFGEGKGAQNLRENCSENMHVLQLDVTKLREIKAALEYINEHLKDSDLWGVVNNAGLNILGEIELMPLEQFEKTLNINIMGMVRVTKACLPLLRESQGRIVNMTSVKGKISTPFNAAYNITKFGGETFSDILRLEVKKWGISVSIIEPGNFGGATGCLEMTRIRKDFEESWESLDEATREIYGKEYMDSFIKDVEDAIPTASFNLYPVIEAMTDALFGVKPKTRYHIPGGKSTTDVWTWLYRLSAFLPTSLLDWIISSWTLKDRPLPKALQTKNKTT